MSATQGDILSAFTFRQSRTSQELPTFPCPDRRLTEVFLDAPIGSKAMYVVHSDFGQCQTNVLYNETEAKSMVSKLRAMSGRPFDEAHPVLDFDLPSLETRVAVIGPPLSPDGTAFA